MHSLPSNQKVEIVQMSINRQRINKLWSICTTDYYSAIKRNKVLIQMWVGFENMLNERPHTLWFHLYKISRISESIETECRPQVAGRMGDDC